jgi:hypothetical protein
MVAHDDPNLPMSSQSYLHCPSPTRSPPLRISDPPNYENDDLDDVFGSAPSSPSHDARGNTEISDIPRLKEKHETEGYRDGVAKGKAETVQGGFDEGYGLGAVLGLRIGKILGIMEGIYAALRTGEMADVEEVEQWKPERERIEGLLESAQAELKTESVFGREWWDDDGLWTFEVRGEAEGMDVVFTDVADAHPLIRKWEAVVNEEVRRWGLDLSVMDNEHDDAQGQSPMAKEEEVSASPKVTRELSW